MCGHRGRSHVAINPAADAGAHGKPFWGGGGEAVGEVRVDGELEV